MFTIFIVFPIQNELIGTLVTELIWEHERPLVEEFLGSRRTNEQDETSRNGFYPYK